MALWARTWIIGKQLIIGDNMCWRQGFDYRFSWVAEETTIGPSYLSFAGDLAKQTFSGDSMVMFKDGPIIGGLGWRRCGHGRNRWRDYC